MKTLAFSGLYVCTNVTFAFVVSVNVSTFSVLFVEFAFSTEIAALRSPSFSVTTMANKANEKVSIKAAAQIDYKGKSINDLSLARVEKNHSEIAFPSAFGAITPAKVKYSLAPGMVKEDIIFEKNQEIKIY